MGEPRHIQLVEYAHITTDVAAAESANLGIVSDATFDWLVDLVQRHKQPEKILEISGDRQIRLASMVGYLQSPDGTGIEILPKTSFVPEQPEKSRKILQKMLATSLTIPGKEYHSASLEALNTPLHEWIFHMFLKELTLLLQRGLRFDYVRVEQRERFIRGQLNIVKQMRQSPARAADFNVRYDLFSPNRLENRLVKTALMYILDTCKESENWRLANEFSHYFDEIPVVQNPLMVIGNWELSKALKHYQAIYPWCKLILELVNPAFTIGHRQGIALLFPMERLFESHVSKVLSKSIGADAKLCPQVSSSSLVKHKPIISECVENWFELKPDLLLTVDQCNSVIDLKWKLLDQRQSTRSDKYAIKQADMYQLFAYGQKYQQGVGNLMLIYPKHKDFDTPLPEFHFDDSLTLWVVPFCLETDCLVKGAWKEHFFGLGSADEIPRLDKVHN